MPAKVFHWYTYANDQGNTNFKLHLSTAIAAIGQFNTRVPFQNTYTPLDITGRALMKPRFVRYRSVLQPYVYLLVPIVTAVAGAFLTPGAINYNGASYIPISRHGEVWNVSGT
jgi:hypothetical protein